jgi:hypothetical protein
VIDARHGTQFRARTTSASPRCWRSARVSEAPPRLAMPARSRGMQVKVLASIGIDGQPKHGAHRGVRLSVYA